MTQLSTRLPFSGFYESIWSGALDREDEQLIDHIAEEPDRYDPALVIVQERGEIGDLLWRVSDYASMRDAVARAYTDSFVDWLGDTLNRTIDGYCYEELNSPRYYNFETDKIFATLPLAVFEEIFERLKRDHPGVFEETVRALFTSYDGFISFYDNDPDVLAAKPLADWDHNELYVLILGWVRAQGHEREHDLEIELYYDLHVAIYQAWSAGIDWKKLDELAREYVADLDLDEDEEARITAPPRCPDTIELPF